MVFLIRRLNGNTKIPSKSLNHENTLGRIASIFAQESFSKLNRDDMFSWIETPENILIYGGEGSGKTTFVQHHLSWARENSKAVVLIDGDNGSSWNHAIDQLRGESALLIKCSDWGEYKTPVAILTKSKNYDRPTLVNINVFDVWKDDCEKRIFFVKGMLRSIVESDRQRNYFEERKSLINSEQIESDLETLEKLTHGFQTTRKEFLLLLKKIPAGSGFIDALITFFSDWDNKFTCRFSDDNVPTINVQELLQQSVPIVVSVTGVESPISRVYARFIIEQYHEYISSERASTPQPQTSAILAWDGLIQGDGFPLSDRFFEDCKNGGGKICFVAENLFDRTVRKNFSLKHFQKFVILNHLELNTRYTNNNEQNLLEFANTLGTSVSDLIQFSKKYPRIHTGYGVLLGETSNEQTFVFPMDNTGNHDGGLKLWENIRDSLNQTNHN